MISRKTILAASFALLTPLESGKAVAQEVCITHDTLVKQVIEFTKTQDNKTPEFRITTKDDGQSLIYWHLGGKTGSFYAVTFKSDGCAILTSSGEARRFTFPKTAFNTGVFFEMDVYKTKF